MQVRGYPLLPSILLVLPRITVVRGYRHAARRFNRVVFDAVNGRRIRRVAAAQMDAVGDAFYVIVMPGTLLGSMIEPPHAPVYTVGGHDTASAVAAVPAEGGDRWCEGQCQ